MTTRSYHIAIIASAAVFLAVFLAYTLPEAIAINDPIQAFAAGFVNPFAAGYSTDVIMCWFILLFWILHEQKTLGIRHGWVCYVLGIVPGVAVGFALYLIVREKQIKTSRHL